MPTIPTAADTKQRRLLMEIGKAVAAYLKSENAGRSFVLLLFDPSKPDAGASGYLSDAKRDAATAVLEAQLEKFRSVP